MALHRKLGETAASLSDAQFELAVARIVAIADNAHTKVREYNRTPRYNRLPIRGYPFADGYYIVRAFEGYEDLLGSRLVAIDGRPTEQLMSDLQPFIGGPMGTQMKYMPYLLESPELLHAAGLADAPDRLLLTMTPSNGSTRDVLLDGQFPDSSDQIARAHVLLAPRAYATSQPRWKALHGVTDQTPLYLGKPIEAFQTALIADLNAFYVQFWANSDVGDVSVTEFCETALSRYRSEPMPVLIVDHRFNGGGNLELTRDCMTGLASSLPDGGRLYIIIGGATFSAGIYSAAFLKQTAGEDAIIVGEPVGDRLISWGEDNLLRLPNSGIEIKFSTGKHDLVNGCDDWRVCHWSVLSLDMHTPNLDPDLYAPLTFQDYAQQTDPALKAIRSHLTSVE
jgi:hypothetical protein